MVELVDARCDRQAEDATTQALALALTKIENLEIALASSRSIGMAVGILMERHKATAEVAFGMLRAASQIGHRKLRDIADDLVHTGALPMPTAS